MNWLFSLIFVCISEFLLGLLNVLSPYISNVFDKLYEVSLKVGLDAVHSYMISIGISLAIFMAVKQMIDIYIFNTSGDSDADPLEMITRFSKTIATIICGNSIITFIVKIAGSVSKDLMSMLTIEGKSFANYAVEVVMMIVGANSITMLIYLLLLALIILLVIIFILKAAKRGVELILCGVLLPIFACDILTTNKERWNAFSTEILILAFGYIIQIFCFGVFNMLFSKVISNGGIDFENLIVSIAWMLMMIKAPKWIEKFSYSSGIGQAAQGGARSVAFMLPSILKKR